jgi:hypothetical protein
MLCITEDIIEAGGVEVSKQASLIEEIGVKSSKRLKTQSIQPDSIQDGSNQINLSVDESLPALHKLTLSIVDRLAQLKEEGDQASPYLFSFPCLNSRNLMQQFFS